MSTKIELFRLLSKQRGVDPKDTHDIASFSIMYGKRKTDTKPNKFLIDAQRLSPEQRAEAVAELQKLYMESGDRDRNGLPIDPNVIGSFAPPSGNRSPGAIIYVPLDFPDRLTEMQAAKAIGVIRFTEITNELQGKVASKAHLHRMIHDGQMPDQAKVNEWFRRERLREPTIVGGRE